MTFNPAGITNSFVVHYYNTLHENPAKLAHLYTADAHLTHSKIPESEDGVNFINKSLENHTCTNSAEIKEFYNNSQLAECKIRITSIDYQPAFNDSILICSVGELASKDEIAVYRFTQSFILVPGKTANVYDVTNDVFRLIPDEDFELNNEQDDEATVPEDLVQEETETSTETQVTETPVIEEHQKSEEELARESTPTVISEVLEFEGLPKEEPKEESKEEPKQEAKEVQEETKKEQKQEAKEELKEHKRSSRDATKETPKETPKEEPKKDIEEKENLAPAPEKEVKLVTPSSWAQAALSSSSKAHEQPKPKPSAKPVGNAVKSPTPTTPVLKNVTNQQKQSQSSGPFLYPVRVGNFNELSAADVKAVFEREFGKTNKVEPKGHYALVNFETEAAQSKALKKKALKIKNSEVTIEEKPASLQFKTNKQQQSGGNFNKSKSKNNRPNGNTGDKKKSKQ